METKLIKVYVAERHYEHEGFNIVGIFLTRDEAHIACAQDDGGDWYEVIEYIIGDIPK